MSVFANLNPFAAARQYGVLPFRDVDDGLRILLVTSRSSGRWILPKGWPAPGHPPAQSAAIEAYEEAGVRGSPGTVAIGSFHHRKGWGGRTVRIEIFPMEVTEELEHWPEEQQRRRQWFAPDAAAAAVTNRELSGLILRFAAERR